MPSTHRNIELKDMSPNNARKKHRTSFAAVRAEPKDLFAVGKANAAIRPDTLGNDSGFTDSKQDQHATSSVPARKQQSRMFARLRQIGTYMSQQAGNWVRSIRKPASVKKSKAKPSRTQGMVELQDVNQFAQQTAPVAKNNRSPRRPKVRMSRSGQQSNRVAPSISSNKWVQLQDLNSSSGAKAKRNEAGNTLRSKAHTIHRSKAASEFMQKFKKPSKLSIRPIVKAASRLKQWACSIFNHSRKQLRSSTKINAVELRSTPSANTTPAASIKKSASYKELLQSQKPMAKQMIIQLNKAIIKNPSSRDELQQVCDNFHRLAIKGLSRDECFKASAKSYDTKSSEPSKITHLASINSRTVMLGRPLIKSNSLYGRLLGNDSTHDHNDTGQQRSYEGFKRATNAELRRMYPKASTNPSPKSTTSSSLNSLWSQLTSRTGSTRNARASADRRASFGSRRANQGSGTAQSKDEAIEMKTF